MEAVQTSELCIYRRSYNWFIHLLFPCSLHKEYIGKRAPQSHFCSRNEVLEGAGGVQVHCWCYRRCWRSRAAAGRAGARKSRQDFLPFSPAYRALLPLMLFPNLPPAAFGRKQMELCRLWGTMPHQLGLCTSWGRGNCPERPDKGLEEEFPVVRPGLGTSLLFTPTQHSCQ